MGQGTMRAFVVGFGVIAVVTLAGEATAREVSVEDLMTNPESYEVSVAGEIVVTGELVLDFQHRGGWVWTQLNDDEYVASPLRENGTLFGGNVGIGVRFEAAAFDEAGFVHPGGYRYRGPVVRARGEWRFRDELRGGESYLAVSSFDIVERERLLEEDVPIRTLIAAMALLLVGTGTSLARRMRRW